MSRTNSTEFKMLLFIPVLFALGCEIGTSQEVEHGDKPFGAVKKDTPIQEIIAQTFVLQDFEALLVATRVAGEMKSPPYTVFAPWDYAFKKVPYWDKMTKDRSWYGHLRELALGHIHQGNVPKNEVENNMSISTLNGDVVNFSIDGGRIRVDGIGVIADTPASDGYIYMLDKVREPRWIKRTILDIINSDERFTILAQILNHPSMTSKREELSHADGSLTFYAPTNTALAGFSLEECEEPDCSALLEQLIGTHLVDAVVPKLFTATQSLSTRASTTLNWNFDDKSITCTKADETQKETSLEEVFEEYALNGIVQPIDTLFCMQVRDCKTKCEPDQCGAIDDGCGNVLTCEKDCEQENIALGKPTSQSSDWVTFTGSAKAVDGKKSREYGNQESASTRFESKPWWQVDFGSPHTINGLKIWTVANKENFLNEFRVDCLDANGEVITTEGFRGTAGETIEMDIQATNVHSLRIRLIRSGYLSLCEVEVYGFEQATCLPRKCDELGNVCGSVDNGCGMAIECGGCDEFYSCIENECVGTNIAENRIAEIHSAWDPQEAVDGNTDSCWLGGKGENPWWRVNFNVPHTVVAVKIWTVNGWEAPLNGVQIDCLDENDNVIATESYSGTPFETIEIDIRAEGVYAVKIHKVGNDYIPLCEVEVYGATEEVCVPKTCEEMDSMCATTLDGCGDFMDCGSCEVGYACEKNQCEKICPVQSCADVGAQCGHAYNNCNETMHCGDCPKGSTCHQNECISCTPKACSEISPSTCGYVDDGCGNLIDCGECENATILVPMRLGKEESWEEFAFLASVPVSMNLNDGRPSVLAVSKDGQLDQFQLDYLRRYNPGSVYTIGKQGLYEGDTEIRASSLDEVTCELAQFFGTSDVAVMSSSTDYHKSLSASALSGRLRAPLFFFDGGSVSSETLSCLETLGVTQVITVGASGQVFSALTGAGIGVEAIEDEFGVISWLKAEGHGVEYFAVCNSYDRSHFFAPKSSLAAPVLAAARNGAVVPLAMESEFQTPCMLTLTDQKPKGAAEGVPYNGKYQWKTGTCEFNGQSFDVALSRHREGNATFGQGNVDFNRDGDFSGPGEFFLKGELRDFGDKTYLIDLDSRYHYADVKLTYPHADALKSKLQQFHDTLGAHPKYMVFVGLPDAIPPHLTIAQTYDLTGTPTDSVFADVDDDPMIDIALGRMLGESAAVMTLAAARSTTYEDLLDYRWKNNVLTTGNFDQPREEGTKMFENRGFNVDSIRSYWNIQDVEYSYISHQDHGLHNSAPKAISGKNYLVPTSPAVVQSIGCQIANISYFAREDYDFTRFGAVSLAKMGVVGFVGASKNAGGTAEELRADYFSNALIYEGATLGEAFRDSLNAVMLLKEPGSEYIWRPVLFGDPALKPYVPEAPPAIQPAKTVVKGDTVTAYAPKGHWVTYHWDGFCNPESKYEFDGPGLSQASPACSKDSGLNKFHEKGRRYISKFTVNRVVTKIIEQDGIEPGLGFTHTSPAHWYAPKYVIDEHPDGSSTVYMNLRFQFFNHQTGEMDQAYSNIEYFLQ